MLYTNLFTILFGCGLAALSCKPRDSTVRGNNSTSADAILEKVDMVAVPVEQWETLKQSQQAANDRDAQQLQDIRAQACESLLKQYNITGSEVFDVTDLHYRHQATTREVESLRDQINKLDDEFKRMRQHIEREPERIAAAVEAAKVHVQNTIEQSGKR